MQHRRFHCYCVGAAKTGTTSIAKAFEKEYKTAHEPDLEKIFRLIRTNNPDISLVRKILLERDQDLQLELESSHPIIFLVPYLVDIFPNAKFIITVREPKAWLSSRLDFHYKKRFLQKENISFLHAFLRQKKSRIKELFVEQKGSWKDYNDKLEMNYNKIYCEHDSFLEQYNVSSVKFYLAEYSNHYKILLESIPKHRRLIVDLSTLNEKYSQICNFLEIPCSIGPVTANINEGTSRPMLIEQIDANYIEQCIQTQCSWYFKQLMI